MSRPGAYEKLDLALSDRLTRGPGRDLVRLDRQLVEVVADEVDERTACGRVGGRAGARELLADPFRQVALVDLVGEELAGLRGELGEGRVFSQLVGDERQHGLRGGALQVRLDRLRVGRLPAVDLGHDHESSAVREESQRVARSDGVLPTRVAGEERLDRAHVEARAQPFERARDLRPVAPGQHVDGLQVGLGHRRQA